MSNGLQNTQMRRTYRVVITIPAANATVSTLLNFRELMKAADVASPHPLTFRVYEYAPLSTTARAAFDVATPRNNVAIATGAVPRCVAADFSTHGQTVPAGVAYDFPSESDCLDSFPRANAGAPFTALCLVGY